MAIDFLKNQGTKLEAAVSALNGAVYQNRGQHRSKNGQGPIKQQRISENKIEKSKTGAKKDREFPEYSEASTLKRSSILEKQDNADGLLNDINLARFAGYQFQDIGKD